MATSSCEALMIWSMSALSFTANRTVVAAWYHPAYGLFLSVPPTNPQAQQTNNGSGGLTSRSLEERPAGVPEAGSPVFQYWIPYPGPRDVFSTNMLDSTREVVGDLITRVAASRGHVVVRVEKGGERYH